MLVPFTDPTCLPDYSRAVAAGLKWKRVSELVYAVQSKRFKDRFYTVHLSESDYVCNCQSVTHCLHGPLAASLAFPDLLCSWLLAEVGRMRVERHDRECRDWREQVRQSRAAAEAETEGMAARFRRRQAEWEESQAVPPAVAA